MTLKQRLDEVWNTGGCLCPNNLVRWSENNTRYKRFNKFGLYYTKGTLRRPKQKKVKDKGWTWLSKFYGSVYWGTKNETPQATSRQ